MESLIHAALSLLKVRLNSAQTAALTTYETELQEWNERINLTAIRDPEGIRTKHFLDSFSCVLAWRDKPPATLIDIGTGAGFPGLPLKIIYPDLQLTLVDSVGKKLDFCRHISEKLGLRQVTFLKARAEELGRHPLHREAYDWAVARAVAQMNVLAEYLLPLVRVGGFALAQKGETGPAEAHGAERAVHLLGGHLRRLVPVTLPGVSDERYLVVLHKRAATPPAYPRLPGTPARKPLR